MRFDTIFDLASLTKVMVTGVAVMQLLEQGQLELDDPAAKYWPDFAQNGKETVTIRQLLTHTAGLPASLPAWEIPATLQQNPQQRYRTGLQQIEQLSLTHKPGEVFTYSDPTFITLGYIVELIAQQPLHQYAQTHILQPLNMSSTTFLPPPDWQPRIAPTYCPVFKQPCWGQVNDPTTVRMGGVTGAAGLFGNATDVGKFLQCILKGGRIEGDRYLLGPLSIVKMTAAQTPLTMADARGLAWDIDSAFSNRGSFLPKNSFGHSGWVGTSMWADPASQTWIVILTSRTHPTPAQDNQLIRDRRTIANIVAASLIDIDTQNLSNTSVGELTRAFKL
jgi:CubicO group peptidase (beta-lactamase class C family)